MERRRPVKAPARGPSPAARLALFLGPPALVVAVAIGYAVSRRAPADAPAPPAAAADPVPTPAEARPVDAFLERCRALAAKGRLTEAGELVDWHPPEGLRTDEARRLAEFREDLRRRAAARLETRAAEAVALAREGKMREATDRCQDFEDYAPPAGMAAAYEKIREAGRDWIQSRRAAAHEETTRALAARASADAALPAPADPAASLAQAEAHLAAGRAREAEALLGPVLRHEPSRLRAHELRARSRRLLDDALGVLQDAAAMIEGGRAEPGVELIQDILTRAPVDETVLRRAEAWVEKAPAQPRVWALMAQIWTWRHDPGEASKVYFRAAAKKVAFDGRTSAGLTQYLELRERGFPGGKPVVSDYAGPYEILTDAGPRRARQLALQLDGLAKEYGEGFARPVNPLLRFRVMFFSTERDYSLYHKGIFGMSAGERGAVAYYSPGIKQLVVVDNPKDFAEVVRHEAFHQFLDYFVHGAPRWFNEGSAAFFEESTFGRASMDEKYHRGARHGLQAKVLPPLAELLTMPASVWVGDPREFLFYCQSWSFIYWLHRQGHEGLWKEYLARLIAGAEHAEVHRAVFAPRLAELEPAWRRSVLEGRYDR